MLAKKKPTAGIAPRVGFKCTVSYREEDILKNGIILKRILNDNRKTSTKYDSLVPLTAHYIIYSSD